MKEPLLSKRSASLGLKNYSQASTVETESMFNQQMACPVVLGETEA